MSDSVQYAKVQPPPLRDETLARDRLLDWLHAKIHSRVVLILADAGYGKTTLLADFARRTRLRSLWYRLDDDDLDWTSLLHHLVAAGREHDPGFAPATLSMLSETGIGGPSREAVLDVFIRELPTIAPNGAILILDDFHLVDEAQDARFVVRELVARAPERLSIVIASRRGPAIPLARLRANGEVAELGTDDLRFDVAETARLFTETYGRILDPDVLEDVARRTEGWAASLQLVQAALRDRTPAEIRRFVRSLSGADQELYDYLAEEVVGDLPNDLQRFLMQTSILQAVTPDLASVVTGLEEPDVSRLTAAAERLTLLGRRAGGPRTQLRYHPLVREFLESRLRRDVGAGVVRSLHERVGRYAEDGDWRTAAHHYSEADDRQQVYLVIDAAAQEIVARGEYSLTESYLPAVDDPIERASFEVLRSRSAFKRGEVAGAMSHARRAIGLDPFSSIALVNLASLAYNVGDFDLSMEMSRRLSETATDAGLRAIASALVAILEDSLDGNIADLLELLRKLAEVQHEASETHFEGITQLNLANGLRAYGDIAGMLEAATTSIDLLESSSAGSELASAHAARGWALTFLYGIDVARDEFGLAMRESNPILRVDTLGEVADAELWFGSAALATDHLEQVAAMGDAAAWARVQTDAILASMALRGGRLDEARRLLDGVPLDARCSSTAHKARLLAIRAHLEVAEGSASAASSIPVASAQAGNQEAGLWSTFVRALQAIHGGTREFRRLVRTASPEVLATLSMVAELVVTRLDDLEPDEMTVLQSEAEKRPERWRDPLRRAVEEGFTRSVAAARLLESVGSKEDIARLRQFARTRRGSPEASIGKSLARRLAPRVVVEDQGRTSITVGEGSIEGSSIRRKVLGLLCYLVSRPRFAATRDEVLDALWPDFDPADALNSLNQTVYFLRRVFEPRFQEDLSPGYLNHEGDLVWFDQALVGSRSQRCWDLIRSMPVNPTSASVAELSHAYLGPFALDFAYEEWATAYRSNLQSSYLQIVEKSVYSDIESGHFDRGILLARRALDACPEADSIELSLLRLYKLSGSHAAAAEQYSHYSVWVRDTLGIEPPSLDSL